MDKALIKPYANLYGADLYGADLHEADLYGADLHEADLHEADLYGANLREANLIKANLYGANLIKANLYGADLRGADLRGANLIKTNFRRAIGIIDAGEDSRGYRFLAVQQETGYMIKAGCRWFTPAEAQLHWHDDKRESNFECRAKVHLLITMAEKKGWF